MRLSRVLLIFTLAVLPMASALAFQESNSPQGEISGPVRVVDGDTLAFGQQRVRLFGIDAPESSQVCDVNQSAWRCGQAARDMLTRAIGGGTVTCQVRDQDPYGRLVAVCENQAGDDLNAWMVSQGLAVAYVQYSRDYVSQEREARSRGNGVWAGPFERPDEYRRRQAGNEDVSSFREPTYSNSASVARTSPYGHQDMLGQPSEEDETPKPTFRAMACLVVHKGC